MDAVLDHCKFFCLEKGGALYHFRDGLLCAVGFGIWFFFFRRCWEFREMYE